LLATETNYLSVLPQTVTLLYCDVCLLAWCL